MLKQFLRTVSANSGGKSSGSGNGNKKKKDLGKRPTTLGGSGASTTRTQAPGRKRNAGSNGRPRGI